MARTDKPASKHQHKTLKTFFIAVILGAEFILASAGDTTNQPPDVAPQMSERTYKIAPGTFYDNLKHLMTPKAGESDLQLLRRFFREHHVDLDKPKSSVFVNDKLGRLFVNVTPEDQNEVERLVAQIVNAK